MSNYTKVDGPLAADTAREALDAAVANGFREEDVLVVDGYFLVPDEDGDRNRYGQKYDDFEESAPAVEATLDAWGERADGPAVEEGAANIEVQEAAVEEAVASQPADTAAEYPDGEPSEEWTGKQIDAYARDNKIKFDNGVTTKAEKVAAIRDAAKN